MKLLSRVLLSVARRLPRGYWPLVRFAARRDPALWDVPLPLKYVPGSHIRADLRETVFTPFLRYGCFPHQTGEDELCMALLQPGERVFDVGANIGYPTILLAEMIGETGLLLALEPSRRAFGFLSRTLGNHPNVRLLNLAASDTVGAMSFYETSGLDTSSLEAVPNVEPYSVTTTTVDQLVEDHGVPVFVKIDVEGHEPAVFRGMSRLLASETPPIVLFEALSGSALAEILDELNRLAPGRYDVHRVLHSGTLRPAGETTGTSNFLAVPAWARPRIESRVA